MSNKIAKLGLAALLVFVFAASGFSQTTQGNITADETWTGTVVITGDVNVRDSATLTIDPGTIIKFNDTSAWVDTNGNSDKNHIYLTIIGSTAAVVAKGNKNNWITFTSSLTTPVPGAWGKIRLVGNRNNSSFTYCNISYPQNGLNMQNDSSAQGPSSPTVNNIIIHETKNAGIFAGEHTSLEIDSSIIYNCQSGVFYGLANKAKVTNTILYNLFTGFIFGNNSSGIPTPVTVDHVTIAKVSTGSFKPWDGAGIALINAPGGTLTVTNSIFNIGEAGSFGLKVSGGAGWIAKHSYNAWYDNGDTSNLGTYMNHIKDAILNDSVNTADSLHSIIDLDPVFVLPDSGDYRLGNKSPLIGKASDGTNIGASQEVVTAFYEKVLPTIAASKGVTVAPHPFLSSRHDKVKISFDKEFKNPRMSILDVYGNLVKSFSNINASSVSWDGTNNKGVPVQPGYYFYLIQDGQNSVEKMILLTK